MRGVEGRAPLPLFYIVRTDRATPNGARSAASPPGVRRGGITLAGRDLVPCSRRAAPFPAPRAVPGSWSMVAKALPEDRTRSRSRVSHELRMQRFLQPDDVTCGPTCLRKVYNYYGIDIPVEDVVGEIDRNEDGGTLAVFLGASALNRGMRARIFSYDLRVFDPTWARIPMPELARKVEARLPYLRLPKTRRAGKA